MFFTGDTRLLVGQDVNMICLLISSLILFSSIDDANGNAVRDVIDIHCGDSPVTSSVNVTYFGEGEELFPMNNLTMLHNCPGEYKLDGTYIIVDVNHRDCAFFRLRHTNTWTVKVKLQWKSAIQSALDKEYYLSCVYDDYQESLSVAG